MNLKKTIGMCLILGAANIANAETYTPTAIQSQESAPQHGFYVGAGLGGISISTERSVQGTDTTGSIDADDARNETTHDGNIGLNSVLFAGYNWTFSNKLFLGGEAFANLFNTGSSGSGDGEADIVFEHISATATATAMDHLTYDNAYGIRALPGYRVSHDAVIYGIVGYSSIHGKNSGSSTYTTTTTVGDAHETVSTDVDSFSDSHRFNGYQLGLGSMINITEHIAVRGDLIYTQYERKTLYDHSWTDGTASDTMTITAQPSSLEADASLVYLFD